MLFKLVVGVVKVMLESLFERNDEHLDRIGEGYFEDVRDGQNPVLVSVCCSDSRVSQEGMWSVDQAGWLFTSSNIGNQVWDMVDGERVVDGSLLYPVVHTGTTNVAVVGHTGCGAVTAAYKWVVNDEIPRHEGVRGLVEMLVPVVEEGLEQDSVRRAAETEDVVNRLCEFSVRRQVKFLVESDDVPSDVDVYGFIYDIHGAYGIPGRTNLIIHNLETDLGNSEEFPTRRSLLD